ncbi:hypothetical protein, partial [Micromonospora sp. NPDC049102]|uniref:hypothetical protein n=1 Tax=Micromonospora sp. NPDC049102 TaxID=3364265 RepID=UPI00371CA338
MTDADAVLRIADLRRACSMLLDAAESRFGPEIQLSQLDVDHYWNMDLGAAFRMVQQPELEIDCGQSSDDVAELAVAAQADGPIAPVDVPMVVAAAEHRVGQAGVAAVGPVPDVVESARGAVAALPLLRFPGPLSEPGVRLSPHR